jgi:predicted alpha/beta hydrolase family esterase
LVAVPDPEGPAFPEVALSFAPAPRDRIAFPTLLVASHDDPYASFAFAERCASAWHSTLHDIGRAGHINAESGLGDWPDGRVLLRRLSA